LAKSFLFLFPAFSFYRFARAQFQVRVVLFEQAPPPRAFSLTSQSFFTLPCLMRLVPLVRVCDCVCSCRRPPPRAFNPTSQNCFTLPFLTNSASCVYVIVFVRAGAPPDAFSPTGQNWGFPTYNWEEMAKDNYKWCVCRIVIIQFGHDVSGAFGVSSLFSLVTSLGKTSTVWVGAKLLRPMTRWRC